MTLEIALSLLTFAGVFLFVHIKIKKNRDSVFEKIEDNKKRVENEIDARLNFVENKQLRLFKESIDQIEFNQLVQQNNLEEIKKKSTKNSDEFNHEIQSLQRQIQELTQCVGELQQKFSENLSLKSFQNQNSELDEMQYMPFGRINGLDGIDELARAVKEKNDAVTKSKQLTNITTEIEEISKSEPISPTEANTEELILADVAIESNPMIDSSQVDLTNNEVEPNITIENDSIAITDKISESLSIEDKTDIAKKSEADLIEEYKTTSIEEAENHSVEVETVSTPEIAASSIQVTEPDCWLMTTESGKTTLRGSRSQRYELIRQTVKKIQPIAQALRPAHRSTEKSESTVTRTRILAPSILAFHKSGQWEFFVELPKQTIPKEKIAYLAQGQIKIEHQDDNFYGPLRHLDIPIEICSKNSGKINKTTINITSNNNPVLIFCLTEDDNDWKGTLVSRPSKGFYLAIAPTDWSRYEETGGQPPIDPEPLQMLNFTAHYFDTQQGQFITFLKPSGQRYQSKPKRFDLILEGKMIDDAEKRLGPLFYDAPPVVSGDHRSWGNICSIVVGEEGQGQWRQQYDVQTSKKWQIPSLGPKRNSGWFFLRFYDDTGYLVNSLSFRFIQGLKSIQTNVSVFPGYRKERPARLEFSIAETIYINPVENSPKLEVETDDQYHKITGPVNFPVIRTVGRAG